MSTKPQVITFTDVETTGLDPYDDEIIQLAAVKVIHHPEDSSKVIRLKGDSCRMECKIFPTKPVSKEVAAINGYDPKVWEEEAISLEEALERYAKFVLWTNFGGQNPAFDKGFLNEAFKKTGMEWPRLQGYRLVAVEMTAWPLFLQGKIQNVKQETLARYFGLGKQTHDALDDVDQSIEIYSKCIEHAVRSFADFEPK